MIADGNPRAGRIDVAGVSLSSPHRTFFPDAGVTKLELARFYESIAEWILPHLRGRLISLVRCPRGSSEPCFFQRHPGDALPRSVRRMEVREKEGRGLYLHVDSVEGLIALIQLGTLELHGWGSRIDDLERPDRMVFDLDPAPEVPWKELLRAARAVRDHLRAIGVRSWPMTTGGKGLHVVVPLQRRHGWEEVRTFSKSVAETLVRAQPGRYTATMSRAKRSGRVFIDHFRNGRGATSIVPYSTRARPGAPVAVPLRWDEVGPHLDPGAGPPGRYHLRNLGRRIGALRADPWLEMEAEPQRLELSSDS